MTRTTKRRRAGRIIKLAIGLTLLGSIAGLAGHRLWKKPDLPYQPRLPLDASGFGLIINSARAWEPSASLGEIAANWKNVGTRLGERIVDESKTRDIPEHLQIPVLMTRAMLRHSEGEPREAYRLLEQARALAEAKDSLAIPNLYAVIYFQGVSALRRGEDDNCIDCRGESSCILPISEAARHRNETGSRLAIGHFTEYLRKFPDDLEARWLLNVAHMTLGEYPDKVDRRYLVAMGNFAYPEFDIGRFRDIGAAAGVNRLNQAGGAIMDDFDNDGLLDLAVTSFDPTMEMAIYRNKGDGTFEERGEEAGVSGQLGGLYCVQADYDNDGFLDIYIPRGAWLSRPIRPSLLRNKGDGTFEDVTAKAGLLDPVNSNSACWGDYDNDGFVDLFVCCELQTSRLYRNKGDGTFEEVAKRAGVDGKVAMYCKGANWIDIDNDGDSDLFVNSMGGTARLYRNDGKGAFDDVTLSMNIDGPRGGFSCWAWDYDNDGWMDIFATCYDRSLADVVRGLTGEPHRLGSNRLFRNDEGRGFVDVTREAGLDLVFATMGSNFADFDNDGYPDFYLATGEPSLGTLIPNRMFKNVDGKRFSEITTSAGTGHLQKGHAVACGDWDRDGDIDLFAQTGGAVNGDRYHNILFDNPGQGNHWLKVKLVGKKTNRAAIGARLKVETAGEAPRTIRGHVTSGSSFGANTLQQSFGLAGSTRIARLEITWPTSGTTQVFKDLDADQAIEITEFAADFRKLDAKPLPRPE